MIPQGMQQQQQQGINALAQTGDLSQVPPEQLVQMARNPGDSLVQLAALGEVQRRKNKELQQQAAQAKRQPQQTVAQQVLQGMPAAQAPQAPPSPLDVANPAMMAQQARPPMQGLPQLPTGQAIPPQYAGGGIVAFEKGGWTNNPEKDPLNRRLPFSGPNPNLPAGWNAREREQWGPILQGAGRVGAGFMDAATLIPRGLMGAGNTVIGGARALGVPVPYMSNIFSPEPGDNFESLTPWGDHHERQYAQQKAGAAPAGDTPPWMGQQSRVQPTSPFRDAPVPPDGGGRGSARAGIASLGKAPGFPEYKSPYEGAPEYKTEEEREAMIRAAYERIKAERGPDAAEEFLREIRAEREGMGGKYDRVTNDSLVRMGMGLMSGKSKNFFTNFGNAGIATLDVDQARRDKLDAQARELRRQEMEGRLGVQQRDTAMRGEARQQGEAAATRADRTRAETVDSNKDRNQWGLKGAEFALKSRELDIKMASVNVDAMRNEIMRTGNKADVIARIYQTAQEKAWSSVNEDPRTASLPANARAQMARELAQEWIKNNVGLDILEGNAGVRGAPMPQRMQWPGSDQSFPTSRAPR
jgi:hypothetical protein